MTYDWAMLEALEEVDAIGWAAPPVAPPKPTRRPIRSVAEIDRAMAANQAQVNAVLVGQANWQPRPGYVRACNWCSSVWPEETLAVFGALSGCPRCMANQVAQADQGAQMRIRGSR